MLFCTSAVGIPATEALKKGLEDLHELCQHVLHTFEVWSHMHKSRLCRLTFKLYGAWFSELYSCPCLVKTRTRVHLDVCFSIYIALMKGWPSLCTSLSLFLQSSVTKFKESQSQDYEMT